MALAKIGIFSLGAACSAGLLHLLQRRRPRHARFVPKPHPNWQPGQHQPPPYGMDAPMISLDPAAVDKASMYAFVISAVVPRPIAFVSTVSADGDVNLAPYSYFNVMGHNPPVLTVGMCRSPTRGGGKKDSLINVEETGWVWNADVGERLDWGVLGCWMARALLAGLYLPACLYACSLSLLAPLSDLLCTHNTRCYNCPASLPGMCGRTSKSSSSWRCRNNSVPMPVPAISYSDLLLSRSAWTQGIMNSPAALGPVAVFISRKKRHGFTLASERFYVSPKLPMHRHPWPVPVTEQHPHAHSFHAQTPRCPFASPLFLGTLLDI